MSIVQEYAEYQRKMKQMGYNQTYIDTMFIKSGYELAILQGCSEDEAEIFATNCAEAIRRFHSTKSKLYFIIGVAAIAAAVVLILT